MQKKLNDVTVIGGGVFAYVFVKCVDKVLFTVHVASKLTCWLKPSLWKILL